MSITLPKLPMLDLSRDNLYGYTADQLRARDIEVARLVLEAAAQAASKVAAQYAPGSHGHSAERAANAIRAMGVRHHE